MTVRLNLKQPANLSNPYILQLGNALTEFTFRALVESTMNESESLCIGESNPKEPAGEIGYYNLGGYDLLVRI